MKKILKSLYSTRLMGMLFIIFAIAMGVATFIENDYGTQTSKALIYNTWWFELILVVFVINFFGNIFKYKLHKKEKWAVLLLHLAFLFIIIGAGITRYIGYEGMMILDEGQTSNKILSEKTYLNVVVDDSEFQKEFNTPLLLSSWGKNNINFTETFKPREDSKNYDIDFKLVDYIPHAERHFIEDPSKPKHLLFIESSGGGRHEHYIKEGSVVNVHNVLVGFDTDIEKAMITIKSNNGNYQIYSRMGGEYMTMATGEEGTISKDSLQSFKLRSLYHIGGLPFVVPKPAVNGEERTMRGNKNNGMFDVVVFDITVNNKTIRKEFRGGQYNTDDKKEFSINGLNFRAWYGAKQIPIPFSVKLKDFQLEKYPGSESAASYASEITVKDTDKTFDYRIYMNHILDYKGFRLFQASYKNAGQAIEQSHFSVNHDFWGTTISYIGYFLLYFSLIVALFVKGTRFYNLKKSLKSIRKQKALLSVFILFSIVGTTYGQDTQNHQKEDKHQGYIRPTDTEIDSLLKAKKIDKHHAESFSKLVIQDAGGRMKPVHTFASELVRKVAHTENFRGLTPSQVFLSMIEDGRFWFEVPFIYLGKKGNHQIRKMLGVDEKAKYARFSDFITPRGEYKIQQAVDKAQRAKIKNQFDKDLLKVDKRIGLMYSALSGSILRIYPVKNDPNNKWVSHLESNFAGFKGQDSIMIPRLLPTYIQTLQLAKHQKDYTKADEVLKGINAFQHKYGGKIIPSSKKIDFEITYNKLKIFMNSSYLYLLWGLLMIVFVILQIFFSKSKWINYTIKGLGILTFLTFCYHTFGLGLRWYISGNAPWSNAYESIIYVAWATMLFGLFLGRKSALTIGATTFLTSIILMFAHMNWLDPEIANLQPVLNSWWLMVHVSVIVASYGPFSMCMILGILVLILTVFTNNKNKEKMDINIKELTIINEMSMNVGLVLLTIGNFLGGMWANESWGRYWGWDPKETWALVSIMVYAFVLHMRLIPKMKGRILFNFMSAFAFLSILMTYFGVNFYLSGMHSYASGEKAVTPTEAYYYIAFVIILTIYAWFKDKKYFKN